MTAANGTGAALGDEIVERIDQLAAISERAGEITRVFLSAEHRAAAELILSWMQDAGMTAHMDAIGNVIGRYEGNTPRLPALLLGSHFDTVRNAGKWDGPLGVVTAIACVNALNGQSKRLPFAIEVAAFADEEGVRFASTLIGSRAVAGSFDEGVLATMDRNGTSLRQAMREFGLDPQHVGTAARAPSEFLAYLELHIEQGPVLEAEDLPLGVVTAISGATRLSVSLEGMAGHAGTVPMAMRRDALAGAAECIVAIERQCRDDIGLFGTVGSIHADPGATNVIPGRCSFTVDMRCASDQHRRLAVAAAVRSIEQVAKTRGLHPQVDVTYESRSVRCADWLQGRISEAMARQGFRTIALPSGAGHDGLAIAELTDIGMIFVRCRGGVSHHPDEHVAAADIGAGARVLLDLIEHFEPKPRR